MRNALLRRVRELLPDEVRRPRRGLREAAPAPGRAAAVGPRQAEPPGAATAVADPLVETLRTGGSVVAGLLAEVRSLLRADRVDDAGSVAAALVDDPLLADVGHLAGALVAVRRDCPDRAWQQLRQVPSELWTRYAAPDYVRLGVRQDREHALDELRRLVDSRPDHLGGREWLHLVGSAFAADDLALAREAFGALDDAVGRPDAPTKLSVQRDWLEPWVGRTGGSPSAPAPADADVSFAVVDYGHPGRSRASANIGDHIQTMASLGHLVRHQDLRFTGPQDLVDLLEQLRGRVREDRRRSGLATRVNVLTVDRDASPYEEVPERTWMLAFGWYMHAIFGTRYAFPMHDNLLPIFVSFHCNKRDLLTPQAVEYLRRFAPIGCRDHTTVDILLSMGVPAFFSGCVTTTIDTVFPELPDRPAPDRSVAYVDVPEDAVPPGGAAYKHSSDQVRFKSFTTNMYDALELLENYRRNHAAAVTSRLHAYLPLRSIGVPVDFRPPNRADVRFPGLIDIGDDEFDRIRRTILDKLEQVLGLALGGAEPEAVYAEWRRLNEPDVEAARRRLAAPGGPTPVPADLDHQVDRAVAGTRTRRSTQPGGAGPDLHVAVRYRAARQRELAALLESLVASSSRPLHVWLLDEGRKPAQLDRVASAFPQVTLSAVPTTGLGADLRDVTGARMEGLDVLLVHRLLPEVPRVVLLPLPSVVEADVAALHDLDLGDHAVAFPRETRARAASGFGVVHAAANRLDTRTTAAAELRRRAHARHAFDFDAFCADTAVVDLDRVRETGLLTDAVGIAEEFGLTSEEVLHLLVGPDRATVPDEWHHVPTRGTSERPALVHWADAVKPWDSGYVEEQQRWLGWWERSAERR